MKHTPRSIIVCLLSVAMVASVVGQEAKTKAKPAEFNVMAYGAVADGVTLTSEAIKAAIDDCHVWGGGTVVVPAGEYVCGTLLLKDGVRLHLEKGATLLGSTDLSDYDNPDYFVDAVGQKRGWCLIGIVDAKNVAITGQGTIDGRGFRKHFRDPRPFLVRCVRSRDVAISGVTLRNPAAWTCHLFQSDGVTIRDLTIHSHSNAINDGIDIDSTQNVTIENCLIDTGDDSICIKATSPVATENVTIRGCVLSSHWGAFKMGTESMGDFKNITFSHSLIRNTQGGAMKILSVDGSRIENLNIHDITVENTDMTLFMRLGVRLNKYREEHSRTPGHIKGVTIRNVVSHTSPEGRLRAPTGIVITGEKTDDATHRIEDVTIENVSITLEGGGDASDVGPIAERTRRNNYPEYIFFFEGERLFPAYGVYARHVKNLRMEGIEITTRHPDSRAFAFLDNAHDVNIQAKTNTGNGEGFEQIGSTNFAVSVD